MDFTLDYERITSASDKRYTLDTIMEDISQALESLAVQKQPERALEISCNNGIWLNRLADKIPHLCRWHLENEVMSPTPNHETSTGLVQDQAPVTLPFSDKSLDLIYCLNVIHRFYDLEAFYAEMKRMLKGDGVLAIVGIDPHAPETNWYAYEFFPKMFQRDLDRFPSWPEVIEETRRAGFKHVKIQMIDNHPRKFVGEEVFTDPLLFKAENPHLAALSERDFVLGMDRIRAEIKSNPKRVFRIQMPFTLLTASQ